MSEAENQRRLILASTSRYRANALKTLNLVFTAVDPETDEQASAAEKPDALALRLAHGKAAAGLQSNPGCVVIGSDQVGFREGLQLHKPGNAAGAVEQLLKCSGRLATFYTAVAVHTDTQRMATVVPTELQFRALSRQDIENYVAAEPAFDCAGGFKIEGLGISLFDSVTSADPSALIGLPLIATARFLRTLGYSLTGRPELSH